MLTQEIMMPPSHQIPSNLNTASNNQPAFFRFDSDLINVKEEPYEHNLQH